MGKGVGKGKKKKGRPSLLDLQKRSIKEQQQQDQQQKPNSNPYSKPKFRNPIVPNPNPNPNRRFTRRNPVPDGNSTAAETIYGDDDDDEDDSNGKRKEKKLKLVLRLPSHRQHRSSLNSTSLNSGSYGSDSNAEDENEETPLKKRKINAVGDGSDHGDAGKGENSNSGSKATDKLSGILLESGPTTPLPDIKLLVFILDRIQKKDTYSVFSEPVDPKELPDYHEIITHPMDFGTVRMKLAAGAYASLEQFEKDVFLICSNAMQYNAPDTIYFRQARSIQELAKKNFENLRQDSDDNEPEPKVVRRGRPPTKNLKKPLGRPPFERAGSEFSDATLATGADKSIWSNSYDLRKGPLSDKTGTTDASAKAHNGDGYASRYAEHKSGRNDEYPGSMLKGMSMKYGKKNFVLDENKRNTYQQSYTLVNGREPSVLNTFDGERQQLMAVGLHSEYGYSRSLARFAADLGPVAWKVASEKIKRALPAGLKFGPGWVGENEVLPPPQLPLSSPPPPARHLPPQQPHSLHKIPSITTAAPIVESREIPLEKQEPSNNPASDGLPSRPLPPSNSPSAITNRTSDPTTTGGLESVRGLNYESGFSSLNSAVGAVRPRPPFQIHQSPVIHSTLNGFSGGFGFNLASQMGKLVRPARPPSSFGLEASMASQMHDMVSKSNRNFVNQMPANRLESEDTKLLGVSSTINAHNSLPDSGHEAQAAPGGGLHTRPSWRGPSLHQKPDSVPPDLNVRFQSPGSPSSNLRVDSPQPDLALQL